MSKVHIASKIRNFLNTRSECREFLPYIIGKRVAYNLPIPDTLDDLRSYYLENCERTIGSLLSNINEKYIFDVQETSKIIYVIWNTRCQLLYNPDCIDFLSLLRSAKTGLVSSELIDKLLNSSGDDKINHTDLITLERIIGGEIY